MKKLLPMREWTSYDATFAFGVFGRDPGTDVLHDLTINHNLDLLPRALDGLRVILSRIDLEANMIEAMDPPPWSDTRPTFMISTMDEHAIATTCDAAIATDSDLYGWYILGCRYANWFQSPGKDELRQLKTAIGNLPEGTSPSPMAKALEFTLADGLPAAESMRGLLGSDPDREIETMLRWDMVLAQGEWIRDNSGSTLRTASFGADIHDSAQAEVELHNKERVCELLGGVTTKHVDNLVRQGRMPRPVYLGRSPRWRSDELRTWIKAGCPVVDELRFSQFEEERQTTSCT